MPRWPVRPPGRRARCSPSPSSQAVTSGGVSRVRISMRRTGSASSGWARRAGASAGSSTQIGGRIGLEVVDDVLQVGHPRSMAGDAGALGRRRRGGRHLRPGDGVRVDAPGAPVRGLERKASERTSPPASRGSSGSRTLTRGCVRWRSRRASGGASGRSRLGDAPPRRAGPRGDGGEEHAEAMRRWARRSSADARPDRGADPAPAPRSPVTPGIWDPLAGATQVASTRSRC